MIALYHNYYFPDHIGGQRQQLAGPVGVRENERPHGSQQVGDRASFPAPGVRGQHHGSQRPVGHPAAAAATATAFEAAAGSSIRCTAAVYSKSRR